MWITRELKAPTSLTRDVDDGSRFPGVLEAERCKLRCLELKLMKMPVRSRPLEALSNVGAGAETR